MTTVDENNRKVKVTFVKLYNVAVLRGIVKDVPGAAWLSVFLYLIEHLKYGNPVVYGSVRKIAEKCGCHPATVGRILTEMEKHEIIEKDGAGKIRVSAKYGFVGDTEARNKALGYKEEKEKGPP